MIPEIPWLKIMRILNQKVLIVYSDQKVESEEIVFGIKRNYMVREIIIDNNEPGL